jgi:hypothetical protein
MSLNNDTKSGLIIGAVVLGLALIIGLLPGDAPNPLIIRSPIVQYERVAQGKSNSRSKHRKVKHAKTHKK